MIPREPNEPMRDAYRDFLARKAIVDAPTGLTSIPDLPAMMFPFQRDITAWALKRGRAALFEGTGLGKSLQELAWADAVHRETARDILHLAPLAVTDQMVREAEKFGIAARQVRDQAGCLAGNNITNFQKLDHFDLSKFGGVILDECFAPDTLIDMIDTGGTFTRKHIETVREGDSILNAAGVDTVSDVHRREVPYAVQVTYGAERVTVSPNHPFLTMRGWVGAQDLEPGDALVSTDEAVRLVRRRVSRPGSQSEILRAILLSEMADEPARARRKGSHARGGCEARREAARMARQRQPARTSGIGSHPVAAPVAASRCAGENLPPIERDGPRTFRAWGQWIGNDGATGGIEGCSVRAVGGGVCFIVGATDARLSHMLQARLGERRSQSRYRGGWTISHGPGEASAGRKEGRQGKFVRVEGVEVYEPSDTRLDRYRDADGKLYFYDLGGTRHPSFSVGDCLVHNSSILKSTDGHYRTRLISECAQIPFRLAATATPAPNDFMELGNHAEFLGVMSYTDMLATFFTHDGGDTKKWRLKGHAENEFWKWMASWAVMLREPADLGYSNDGYNLPELRLHHHAVKVENETAQQAGFLFAFPAQTMAERLAARRSTVDGRVALAAEITPDDRQFVWWCNLNSESEALTQLIPGAVETRGSDSDDEKVAKLRGFSDGSIRVLVTKPKVAGFGMNWQHCNATGFIGLNDSWEQYYQAVRRFWRFGQTHPVDVHLIAAETEGNVVSNLRRKEADADRMMAAMIKHTQNFSSMAVRGQLRDTPNYQPNMKMELPAWAA